MTDVAEILEQLDKEGYRLTGPRRLVLEEVAGRDAPFTSADLWASVQRSAPSVGRATVFRTLDLLTKLGVVQRIHEDASGGRCHAYIVCDQSHHHHLICSGCGSVADFHEDRTLDALVREIERRTDFKVEGHRLELVGQCAECRSAESSDRASK